MTDTSETARNARSISRRRFVQATGASGVAIGLAGCGGTSETTTAGDTQSGDGTTTDGTTTTTTAQQSEDEIVITYAAESQDAENQAGFNQVLRDNGMSDDIKIEMIAGTQVTDDRQSKYTQWLQGERPKPTLLMMDSGWTVPFIGRGQLEKISNVASEEVIEKIDDQFFDATTQTATGPDGSLYAVPRFPGFPTMLYRKDLFEAAGYGPSDFKSWRSDPPRWQEFAEAVKTGKAESDVKYGYTFQAAAYEGLSCCDFNEFISSWGGAYFGNPKENLFKNIGSRPITVDEQQVIDSIKMVKSFIHGPDAEDTLDGYPNISPRAVLQWQEETSRKPFTQGRAVAHRNWTYAYNLSGTDDKLGDTMGGMPIPYSVSESEAEYPMTGGPVAALGGWHTAVNPHSPPEKKRAAGEALKAMTTEGFFKWQLENTGNLPTRPDLFDTLSSDAPMGEFMDVFKVAGENAIPRPATVIWPQESTQIAKQANKAYADDKTASTAMADLAAQLEQIEQSV